MTNPSWDTIRPSEQLANTPAAYHGGRWWLVAPSGAIPADEPALARELGSMAADMAAANRAVAQLELDSPAQGQG